jgi:pimeloyl-ACP methyl ester carboxylesterase
MKAQSRMKEETHGYAPVNGLKMYFEIKGSGDPLVYIPPVLASAGTNSFPALNERFRVVTADLQGHGRTADIPDRAITLEQHAKDLVGLLRHLGIAKAHFFGESYGGVVAILLALRYPELVGRVATYGATFGSPQVAHNTEMLCFDEPPTADSKCFQFQKEGYRKVAPDPDYWPVFWGKALSIEWRGFSNEELASIKTPVLIALGDHDFVRVEHALETFRTIPNAELAVVPSAGHFALFSEQAKVIPLVEHFLSKSERQLPVATATTGYRPGKTR